MELTRIVKKILEKLDVLDRLYHITVDKKILVKRSEKEKVNSTKTFGSAGAVCSMYTV